MGLLTIGIFGLETEQEKLRYMVNTVQQQLNAVNREDVDAFYCVDKGETSNEDKMHFIKNAAEGIYICFVSPNFIIPINLVKDALADIESGQYNDTELLLKGIHRRTKGIAPN
jgi:hypothetical protein